MKTTLEHLGVSSAVVQQFVYCSLCTKSIESIATHNSKKLHIWLYFSP